MASLVKAREVLRLKRLAQEADEKLKMAYSTPAGEPMEQLIKQQSKKSTLTKEVENPVEKIVQEEKQEVPPINDKKEEDTPQEIPKEQPPNQPTKKMNIMDLFLIPPDMDSILSTPVPKQKTTFPKPNYPSKKEASKKRKHSSEDENESDSSEEEEDNTKHNKKKQKVVSTNNPIPGSWVPSFSSMQTSVGGLLKKVPIDPSAVAYSVGSNLLWAGGLATLIILRGFAQNYLEGKARRISAPASVQGQVVPNYLPQPSVAPSNSNYYEFTR